MAALEHKALDHPDETRKFAAHGYLELVNLTGFSLGRATFEPGWRWSNDVKPIAGTDRCMARHTGYVLSGTIVVEAEDGSEARLTAGDGYVIEPGHDAWVVGLDPCIMVDFSPTITTYALPEV
jgi:hypothetical protein